MQKIIFTLCLFFLFNIFFYTIIDAIPHKRYRRQLEPIKKANLPYEGWAGGASNPSGGAPGAYYGTGVNPNYGGIRPHQNSIESGVNVISYNHQYTHGGLNSNLNTHQQQQQQYYSSNNNYNNAWQRPNTNNYYNQPYNRYAPGSQGWYATGGNYWYNKGQSFIPHAWLLIIGIFISIICI